MYGINDVPEELENKPNLKRYKQKETRLRWWTFFEWNRIVAVKTCCVVWNLETLRD